MSALLRMTSPEPSRWPENGGHANFASEPLERLLAAMPGADQAAELRRELVQMVERRELEPRLIEPSIAFGESDSFRLFVNAGESRAPDGARSPRILGALLERFSIPSRFAERVSPWVLRGGEVLVGIATGPRPRAKLYLRHRELSAVAHLRPHLESIPPDFDDPRNLLGLDFERNELAAVKCYRPTTMHQHDGELRRFLGDRNLRGHLAVRQTPTGRKETVLYAQVEELDDRSIGFRWAERSGAAEARILASLDAEVRALSETFGSAENRHVYLAPPSR